MQLIRKIDQLLNNVTMYRLVIYGLSAVAFFSVVFASTHVISLPVMGLLASLTILLITCLSTNWLFRRTWGIPSNAGSSTITALILFCILPPSTKSDLLLVYVLAGIIAMSSKYLITYRGKQLFNPAAFAALIVSLIGVLHATWWVGNSMMLLVIAPLGLLVLRKLQLIRFFTVFAFVSLSVTMLLAFHHGYDLGDTLRTTVLSSPLIFFGTIMVLEPSTLPPREMNRFIYAALIGGLSVAQLRVGSLYTTPELALVVGNLFSFAVSPKYHLVLRLREKKQLSPRVYDFSFIPNRPVAYLAGQYMDFTLDTPLDSRGNRRTFTIASSPTESEIHIGVKFYEPSSAFKKTLRDLKPGSMLLAGNIAGDFTLPKDRTQKLIFIAGGIGITPFRSMVQSLADRREQRDIVIFYMVSNPAEFSYLDIFEQPGLPNVRVVKVVTSQAAAARHDYHNTLTNEVIKREVPDYAQRLFYISGPNAMVETYTDHLHQLGVRRSHIKTDYFSGY